MANNNTYFWFTFLAKKNLSSEGKKARRSCWMRERDSVLELNLLVGKFSSLVNLRRTRMKISCHHLSQLHYSTHKCICLVEAGNPSLVFIILTFFLHKPPPPLPCAPFYGNIFSLHFSRKVEAKNQSEEEGRRKKLKKNGRDEGMEKVIRGTFLMYEFTYRR